METYQVSVVEEKEDLDLKLSKLSAFVGSDRIARLPLIEQERMRRQLQIMQLYSQVLGERIEAFRQ